MNQILAKKMEFSGIDDSEVIVYKTIKKILNKAESCQSVNRNCTTYHDIA